MLSTGRGGSSQGEGVQVGEGEGRGLGEEEGGWGREREVGGGGREHFIHLAIYCTTTWCFALKGLRTTTRAQTCTV